MEVANRVESRDGYLAYEAALGARKLVEEIMCVRPGESVVLTVDTAADTRVAELVAQAAAAARAHPVVVRYETNPTSAMEPSPPVAGAIANADVWIEFALGYLMHSAAFRTALDNGARYANLTGMDVQMLVDTVGRVDFAQVTRLGEVLVGLVERADEVRITTPAGTDVTARNGGVPVHLRGLPATEPGQTVMLSGQISWNPVEATQQGTVVFDGAIWPPGELGLLRTPVRCTVRDGRVVDIEGEGDAAVFRQWMASHGDENMYRVAHWSLGFNPGVTRPTGRIVEDERVFGGVEFGVGTKGAWLGGDTWVAAAHTDGSMLGPSIYLDGEPIEVEGRYVHPDVVAACRACGIAGY